MRIAHRHHDHLTQTPLTQRQVPKQRLAMAAHAQPDRVERDLVRLEPGRSHINPDPAITLEARGDQTTEGLDTQIDRIRQPLIMNKASKATGAIAALFDFAPIGVKNSVTKIGVGPGRGLNDQDLVATNPETAVSQPPTEGWRRFKRLAQRIDDNEIIAGTVHFGKSQAHAPLSSQIDINRGRLRGLGLEPFVGP